MSAAHIMRLLGTACALGIAAIGAQPLPAADEQPPALDYSRWTRGPSNDPSYFPIAVWLQSPRNAPAFKAAGINLFIGLWQGPTEEQLAELTLHGMPVICDQNEVGLRHLEDPIIVGWMHGDEPDNAQPAKDPVTGADTWGPCIPPQRIVDDYAAMVARDPSRPIMLNLGQGVAWDEWWGRGSGASPDDYLTYVKGGDIVSFDIYPVVGMSKPDGENYLHYVPRGLDRLAQWSEGKRILWNVVECTRISMPDKCATPAQVRAEVWMSLIHGSRGIVYFVHQFAPTFCEWALLEDPVMLAAVTDINRQITELAPVLNSPSTLGAARAITTAHDVPVDVMLKRHEGTTYLFAVGMRNKPTDASLVVTNVPPICTAEVIGENRTIPVVQGQFEDHFEPYGVHLYRIR